jgi:hypothetical protein
MLFYQNSLGSRILRKLNAIAHSFYVDVNPDHRSTVFVVGSGRSGTTWIAETLNFDNAYRFIAEPFERGLVPIASAFSPLQYLRPDDGRSEFLIPARTIFEGRVRNAWTDNMNRRIVARSRIVKDVRTTLAAAWIARHFAGMPIVFVLRHPCAVAYSRMTHGWRFRPRDVYFKQPQLMADHLEPFRLLIATPKSEFEEHIVDWCVENVVPMRQLRPDDALVVFYERARREPETVFRAIFRRVGRTFDGQAMRVAGRPSVSTYLDADRRTHRPSIAVDNWRAEFPPVEIDRALAIVRSFGLDSLYGGDEMPVAAALPLSP